jgi:4a-hydroxytetrahydrobiopterin dehydratase
MRPAKLTDTELASALAALPGWELRAGKLHRNFRFRDFRAAFAFMTHCALAAEALDHHPDWSNVYDRVSVDLLTHDVGGITRLDLELARLMSGYADVSGG